MSTRISRSSVIRANEPTSPTVSKYFSKRKAASSKPLTSAEKSNKKARTFKTSDSPASLPIETPLTSSTLVSNSVVTSMSVELPPLLLNRCDSVFYDVPCQDLAKRLLGCVLVRQLDDGTVLKGRIVETECYLGGDDKASHSFNGRMTDRCKPMYMEPGTAYVYMTYGMYHCFNISSQGPGAAVLLRALEPLEGLDSMLTHRLTTRKKPCPPAETARPAKTLKPTELCNGPAKLCTSLSIEKASCNTRDLARWSGMWIERGERSVEEHRVVRTSRIGIESAGIEWAMKPLRFYEIDNVCVSRRDKAVEKEVRELAALLTGAK